MAPCNSTFQSGWIATHDILQTTRTPPVSDVGETANFGAAVISALGQQHQWQRGRAEVLKARSRQGSRPRRGGRFGSCSVSTTEGTFKHPAPLRTSGVFGGELYWGPQGKEADALSFSASVWDQGHSSSADSEFHMKSSPSTSRCLQSGTGGKMAGHKGASCANTSEPIVNAVNNFTSLYLSEGLCLSFLKFYLVNSYWICARKTRNRSLSLVSYYSSETRQPDEKARCQPGAPGAQEDSRPVAAPSSADTVTSHVCVWLGGLALSLCDSRGRLDSLTRILWLICWNIHVKQRYTLQSLNSVSQACWKLATRLII